MSLSQVKSLSLYVSAFYELGAKKNKLGGVVHMLFEVEVSETLSSA